MVSKDCVVIGSGYWGQNIIRELIKKKKLYGIIETNKKLSKIIEKKFHVKILKFKDLKEKNIKNCFITTPSYLHYKHSLEVLKYNKNIFVEKPLSFSEKHIEDLIKKTKNKKIVFMVGYLLIHHPALIVLKKILRKEKKNLIFIKSSRKSNGKIRVRDNVLWNLGIHDFAYILDALELDIQSLNKINFNFLNNQIDESKVYIKFKKNILYSGEFSWLNHKKSQNMVFQTKNKIYIYDDLAENKLIKSDIKIITDLQKNKKVKFYNQKNIKFTNISPLENEINFFLRKSSSNKSNYNNLIFTRKLTKLILNLSK